jgi:1,4-dihydroxy-2-naphthoate octaprenyltransferase
VALVALAFVLVPVAAARHPWAWLALGALALAVSPVRAVLRGDKGLELLPVLRDTGRLELGYAALLALGLAL